MPIFDWIDQVFQCPEMRYFYIEQQASFVPLSSSEISLLQPTSTQTMTASFKSLTYIAQFWQLMAITLSNLRSQFTVGKSVKMSKLLGRICHLSSQEYTRISLTFTNEHLSYCSTTIVTLGPPLLSLPNRAAF